MKSDSANSNIEKFLSCEIKKIEIEKWTEGLRIESDPGQDFILDWITLSADQYRTMWNNCKCNDCKHWNNCGWSVEKDCTKFEEEVRGC